MIHFEKLKLILPLLLLFINACNFISSNCNVDKRKSENKKQLSYNSPGLGSEKSGDTIANSTDGEIEMFFIRNMRKILVPQNAEPYSNRYVLTGVLSKSYNLINELPKGFVRDGSVDYTAIIQRALNKYENIVFPSFPLLINDQGLRIPSDRSISFLKGSEIRLKPSLKGKYSILEISGSNNITLYNPVIRGDRFTHLGDSGEWGMGISIRGSKNVNIYNAKIFDCWGDGIYIGQAGEKIVSEKIMIKDAFLKKNRRDGISVISVDGLTLDNVYAGFNNGTLPMCGINFETNNPKCEIKNVLVINPRTERNNGSGIQIGLSTLIGETHKNIDIKIINHIDLSSGNIAFKISCYKRTQKMVNGSVSGTIDVLNPSWLKTSNNKPLVFKTDQPNLRLQIFKPKVTNAKGLRLNSLETNDILKKYSNQILKIYDF